MKEQYGAGAEADSGAGSGGIGRIASYLFFSVLFRLGLVYRLVFSLLSGDEG